MAVQGGILQTMGTKLDRPLGNSASRFPVLDDIPQRSRTDHSDGMTQEILLKLPACHEHPINKLLPMWIPFLRLNKHLTDVVNRPLNRMFLASLLALHHNGHTDRTRVSSYV